ncbi:MAG: hypothetical protein IJX48_00510 [Paludibacteraceae bacterium]|nr:hypothetical protein [Paludibacteraceae bacterium]
MTKVYLKQLFLSSLVLLFGVSSLFAQQVPNPSFEDWSGPKFDGKIQPKDWYGSNISQVGINFNLTHQEAGHTGSYSMMVKDTEVGALGITEVSPGYFSLGKPWSFLEGIDTKTATAGTSGGWSFKYRPDTMSVWIKRTGANVDKEDFYLLYYAWSGTAKGSKYKAKNGNCSSPGTQTNEESDIRLALDANECGTDQKANQIAEGMWREKKEYGNWTNIKVPIYYFNNDVPTMMNIIFSASNYPNYRANSGLYDGNALYVDDVELIYSSKIQKLYVGGKEWKGFNPNTTEEQVYSLGKSASSIPEIKAYRGAGQISNAKGETATFSGRELTGSEISINNGEIDGNPTTITVKAEDGKSTMTYKIKFVRQASTNAKLANIFVNGQGISGFQPTLTSYNVELPYGTTDAPIVSVDKQEDEQVVEITQPTSTTGSSTIRVTAADGKTKQTYTVNFSVALLSDNTLKDIKINGESLAGFTPNQTTYRVSLPTSTTTMPTVEAISAYPAGEQTITHNAPSVIDGGVYQINVSSPGNPTPKTYKMTFKLEASSYSLLKDLQMGENWITNFNPENLTYYVNLPVGTTELPEVTYVKGESTQTVEVTEGGLNGITRVKVTAGNGINTTEYKINVATALSEISTLNMIYIGGEALEGFEPNVTSYDYPLPIGTTELPEITVDKGDEYQTVSIIKGGLNGTTRITVTAQNGKSTIYQINFSVAQATNASLKMIYLDGKPLEGFDPDILEYNYPLPQGTTELPVITYEQGDDYQTVTVRSGGINGDYKITVRPPSGASKTYVLHFSVATSDNINLKMIYLDGKELEGFAPDKLEYVDTLPMGVSTIPTVTWDKGDESQKILALLSNNVQTITVTAESGRSQTYSITFVIQRSQSAVLKMIYLDGDSLEGFDPQIFAYSYTLTKATCPVITVDKEEGQQVTIATPYAAGQAQISVKPYGAAGNVYTIDFENALIENQALLQQIYIDGAALEGFEPNKFEYALNYQGTFPTVTCDTLEGQKITTFRNGNTLTIYVIKGGDKAQYHLTFSTQLSDDCSLEAILIDGVELAEYVPTVKHYTIPVAAGGVVPTVQYRKHSDQQTVHAGMTNETTYTMSVFAANGDSTAYTLHFDKAKYSDATLLDLSVEGHSIDFEPNTLEYTLNLAEGEALPTLQIVARDGQYTSIHNVSKNEQNVLVVAENGNSNTYKITYTRTISTDAYLKDILLAGVSLEGFKSDVYEYVDSLEWRTRVVPCVQPIGSDNQTITTYHSAINGITRIHVLSADGATSNEYTIHFPVRKSSNVALEYIELDDSRVELKYHPDTTDYTIYLPYQETNIPLILYEAAEEEQEIRFISRPLGQTSQLIVTAEDGSERTYNLTFLPTLSDEENLLKTITIAETGQSLDPSIKEHSVALPYGSKQMNVEYTKAFAEQTVWVKTGGISQATIITVKSNRPGEKDMEYTITPIVDTQNPAVLDSIFIDGVLVNDYDKNRFSYIYNRTNKTLPQVQIKKANGVEVETTCDTWHWQGIVTKQGLKNTYNIYFHYPNDVIPNNDFTQWSKTSQTKTDKPTLWNAPGDYIDKRGDAVQKNGESILKLFTEYDGGLMGAMPAVVNIGKMYAHTTVAGGSSVVPHSFIPFNNTPDLAIINFKYPNVGGEGALFDFIFYDILGDQHSFKLTQKSTTNNYAEQRVQLTTDEINSIVGLDVVIDATGMYPEVPVLGDDCGSELYVDYIRFTYNSKLKAIKVNGKEATRDGNHFTYTLEESNNTLLPTLEFIGEVSDQAQKVTWNNEIVNSLYAERTANITNYAEDGTATEYTLTVRRHLESCNWLQDLQIDGKTIQGFDELTNTYEYHIPANRNHLPDIKPVLASHLQKLVLAYADSTYTISIKPEEGQIRRYTVRIIKDLSNDTKLNSIVADGITDYDPEQLEYTITADKLPAIRFVKNMDGQTVDLNNGTLTVTAENGAQAQYVIRLAQQDKTTTGQLAELEINDMPMQSFSPTQYEYTLPRPNHTKFTRMNDNDSVVFVQNNLYWEWQVFGTEQHTYRITFPTELSSDATIQSIFVNNTPIEGFNSQITEYTYLADSATHLLIETPATATMSVTHQLENDTMYYNYTVTAENGSATQSYTVQIQPNINNNPYLQDISLNGVSLDNFQSDQLNYTIVLPTDAYKTIEPTLPSIQYTTAAPRQQVMIESGLLNESTNIIVTSEDGTRTAIYQLLITAEPSHNAELTGIAVNGTPIEQFEPQRHYYSVQIKEQNVKLTWSSNDNFQDITLSNTNDTYTIHVVAQDGTTSDYHIDIYHETLSENTTLNDILLNGKSLNQFEEKLNPNLEFSPMQQRYTINLPSGTEFLPEIAAKLSEDGQQINIDIQDWRANITVTAPDGVSTNTYVLSFEAPKSNNAHLQMIYINGDSLANFVPENYNYFISLPIGQNQLPNVLAITQESTQTLRDSISGLQHTIIVTAEDGTECQYMLAFSITQSNADTLTAIYENGVMIEGFRPDSFYYSYTLPVGTRYLPELTWDQADQWQTVTANVLIDNPYERTTQINVLAMSGRKNTYTVNYQVAKSDVDTLQMIYIKGDSLPGFNAQQLEYHITLPQHDSLAPIMAYSAGDIYQQIQDTITEYMLYEQQVGWKYTCSITAENGNNRTYTLYFTYAKILSTNSQLANIYVNGESLDGFNPEQFNYLVKLPENAATPSVLVEKAEYQQQVQTILGDTTRIVVTAEDTNYQSTYLIIFQRQQSSYSYLDAIYMNDELIDGFRVDSFEYDIELPFGTIELPVFTYDLGHEKQTVDINTLTAEINGRTQTTIRFSVTAPDPVFSSEYDIRLMIAKNDNSRLRMLTIKGDTVANFHSDSLNYDIVYPIGTDSTELAQLSDIKAFAEDTNAVVTVTEEGVDFIIQVTAQDGKTISIYHVKQSILQSSDASLQMILLDSIPLFGFMPDVLEYTYYINSTQPEITAIANDAAATIEYGIFTLGEPYNIYVTAADGTECIYTITFFETTINSAATPTVNDVLFRHIGGSLDIMFATLRKGVSVGVYDQQGHRLFYAPVPESDQNDATIFVNPEGIESLIDVRTPLVTYTLPAANQCYFYVFFENEKRKIASGKFVVKQ